MKIKVLFIIVFIFTNQSLSQEYILNKIKIDYGYNDHSIVPAMDLPGSYLIGGFSIDKYGNIYFASMGDSAIKKFDKNGRFINMIRIPGVLFWDVYFFKNNLYAIDQSQWKNDLYIFDPQTLKLKVIKKHFYESWPSEQNFLFLDNILVIDLLNKYHVYLLNNNRLYINLKNPFIYLDSLSLEEKKFIGDHYKIGFNPFYVGKMDHYLVFFKSDVYIDNIFEIALVDVKNDSIKKCDIVIPQDIDSLYLRYPKQIRLYKSRYIYALGYENNKLIINIIDLKIIFSKGDIEKRSDKYIYEYLNKFSLRELKIKRNEIFARYGRIFKSKWLQEYFEQKPWYHPNPNYSGTLIKLTEAQKKFIQRILYIEKQKEKNTP